MTILTATLLVAPWTVRNYLVFGEFVPVRTGLGHLAHIGTTGLSKTFAPERSANPRAGAVSVLRTLRCRGEPSWRGLAREAHRRLLQVWQWEDMAAQLGPGVEVLNEAQKDQWLIGEAKAFVIANPLLTAQLGVAKLWSFLCLGWPRGSPIGAVLTVFGLAMCSVLAFREQRLLIPLAMALAYIAPFVIITPLFSRYRYPIEPVIAVLIGVSLAHVAKIGLRWLGALQSARGA